MNWFEVRPNGKPTTANWMASRGGPFGTVLGSKRGSFYMRAPDQPPIGQRLLKIPLVCRQRRQGQAPLLLPHTDATHATLHSNVRGHVGSRLARGLFASRPCIEAIHVITHPRPSIWGDWVTGLLPVVLLAWGHAAPAWVVPGMGLDWGPSVQVSSSAAPPGLHCLCPGLLVSADAIAWHCPLRAMQSGWRS